MSEDAQTLQERLQQVLVSRRMPEPTESMVDTELLTFPEHTARTHRASPWPWRSWPRRCRPSTPSSRTIEVTAEVDKTELAVGEELNLRVRINGSLNPQSADASGSSMVSGGWGRPGIQRETWIRARDEAVQPSHISISSRLRKVGTVTIDPISVTISGQTYRTDPVEGRGISRT